jgi:hypothetical protein
MGPVGESVFIEVGDFPLVGVGLVAVGSAEFLILFESAIPTSFAAV